MLTAAGITAIRPVDSPAVGESSTCTATAYTVTAADEARGAVANTATATADDPDGGPVSSPASGTTTPTTVPAPALSLDKSAAYTDADGSGTATAGDTITFSFTVTNTGNVPLTALDRRPRGGGGHLRVDRPRGRSEHHLHRRRPHRHPRRMDVGSVDNTATARRVIRTAPRWSRRGPPRPRWSSRPGWGW